MLEFICVFFDCWVKGARCERPIHQGKPVIAKSGRKDLRNDCQGGSGGLPEQLFVTDVFQIVKTPRAMNDDI